jgi:hypothetical protein
VIATVVVIAAIILGLGLSGAIPGFHLQGTSTPPSQPPARYPVVFTESGLPSGTAWSVTLAATKNVSAGPSVGFAEADGTYFYSVGTVAGFSASPTNGTVRVAAGPSNVAVSFNPASGGSSSSRSYAVGFSETGLPNGTSWSVTFAGSSQASAADGVFPGIAFRATNGTYPYSVGPVAGFDANPASGNLTVAGAGVSVNIAFTAVGQKTYAVTFVASGSTVPPTWSVTLGGSTEPALGSSLPFFEPNGSYDYAVGTPSGWQASPAAGTVSVLGAAAQVTIAFSTIGPPPSLASVTFSQTGLGGNATWSILLSKGTPGFDATFGELGEGGSLQLDVPAGGYQWFAQSNGNVAYLPDPSTGSINATGGPVLVSIHFAKTVPRSPSYNLTVSESGLPAGTTWTVVIFSYAGNYSNSSMAIAPSSIVLPATNGTFGVEALASSGTGLSGYVPLAYPKFVTVVGAPTSVNVPFGYAYSVSFGESGLPASENWTVVETDPAGNWNGSTLRGANTNSTFALENGTFHFRVWAFGYRATPASGAFTVQGAARNVTIAFARATTYSVTFDESGLPAGTNWTVSLLYAGIPSGGELSDFVSAVGSGPSITLTAPVGNYTWNVATQAVNGWWAAPAAGGIDVNGTGAPVSVQFSYAPAERPVSFLEYWYTVLATGGSPNGSTWSVTINGSTFTTTGFLLVAYEPNGTYSYRVTPPAGWSVVPQYGNLTVNSTAYPGAAEVLLVFYTGTVPADPPGPAGPSLPAELSSSGGRSGYLVSPRIFVPVGRPGFPDA